MGEFRKRKKVCKLCEKKPLNYKDSEIIKRFYISDKGKMLPRRMTGACAKHQRYIAMQIKRARFMALVPYIK